MLLDTAAKAWLLELNSSPSLGASTPLDRTTKVGLLQDTLKVVKPATVDRAALLTEVENILTKLGEGVAVQRKVVTKASFYDEATATDTLGSQQAEMTT